MSMYQDEAPTWDDRDRVTPLHVEESVSGVRNLDIGPIVRLRSGVEVYAPIGLGEEGLPGGLLSLSESQARALHAALGERIAGWDSTPRDVVAETEALLREAGFVSRQQASWGFTVKPSADGVEVTYKGSHGDRDEPALVALRMAAALHKAGYARAGREDDDVTPPEAWGALYPFVEEGPEPRMFAVPPARTY